MKRFYITNFFLVCSISVFTIEALVIVPGLPAALPATLPVSISNLVPVINELADGVFITADQPGAQEFSIAGYSSATNLFIPYALQNITLNGESKPNPLYDARIQFIAFSSALPLSFFVVPNGNTSEIFYKSGRDALLSLESLPDATGSPASGVVAMTGSSLSHVYVAVKPAAGFGQPGSGIIDVTANTEKIIARPAAAALNVTSGALTLGTSPVMINGDPLLAWSIPVGELYAGMQEVVSGVNNSDRAALVARGLPLVNSTANLVFTEVLNPAFDITSLNSSDNYMVVGTGSSITGSLSHVQTMETSTRQPLLVVCGRFLEGSETPNDVKNEVYALPLNRVFHEKQQQTISPVSGYLAKKGATDLAEYAKDASELYTRADAVVRVGKGPLLDVGTVINQILIQNDTVYAVVNDPIPGIYASHALFDAYGLVREWTPWQRAVNTPNIISAAALNTITGTWFMGTTSNNFTIDTVVRTTWQSGQALSGVADALMGVTAPEPQSITALSGYDYRTLGMGSVAAFVCTERNQVILAQAGVLADGSSTLYEQLPNDVYTQVVFAEDTVLTTPVTTEPLVVIRGGLMAEMTPLTTATIVHSTAIEDTWLCVGGNGGIAIWATENGAGWGDAFGDDLSQLPVGLRMQKLGNFKDVRTLYADGALLYVVTPHTVSRVDLTDGIENVTIAVIAETGNTLPGSTQKDVITDVLFSQDLGLVATNIGFYRIKNSSSALAEKPEWYFSQLPDPELPESELPVKKITGYGSNGLAQSLFNGGYCMVLSGTARDNRSTVNRIAIEPFNSITETTVLPFKSDWFINYKPSFFLDFGEYKDVVVTDGGQYIFARSVEGAANATLSTPNIRETLTQPRSTNRFIGQRSVPLRTALSSDSDIITVVQDPATGAWYIATNKGLVVQG